MQYIDCFLTPVPLANKARYQQLALIASDVVRDHGALRVVECWLDEAGPDPSTYHAEHARLAASAYGGFHAAAGAREGETVVMSWIEWPDKRSRDDGMAKVIADPRMQFHDQVPVFDGSRLVAAGFLPMLDHGAGA